MIPKACCSFFIDKHVCDDRFIDMARLMGMPDDDKPEDFITMLLNLQKARGADNLKMSDYGITPDEFPAMVQNARDTLGKNFLNDLCPLTDADHIQIYTESYR